MPPRRHAHDRCKGVITWLIFDNALRVRMTVEVADTPAGRSAAPVSGARLGGGSTRAGDEAVVTVNSNLM